MKHLSDRLMTWARSFLESIYSLFGISRHAETQNRKPAKDIITHQPQQFGFPDEASAQFPRMILACITQPCNARCPHCFLTTQPIHYKTHFGALDNHRYLPWEMWKALVDECAEWKHSHIRISSYGETLLHKEFPRFIRYARECGVSISVITNGSLLTEDIARLMVEIGVQSVEISVETHRRDLYEAIKVGLDFDTMRENVERLVRIRDEAQSEMLIIGSIVNQPNANPDIDEAVRFWEDRVDHVSVRHFVTWGLEGLADRGESTSPYLSSTDPCPYPYERLMTDPSGDVRLCPYDNQAKIPPFGRLSIDTIYSIWHGLRHDEIKACHANGRFNHEAARRDAPLCAGCDDRVNRSWTFNYLSIPKKVTPRWRRTA